MPPTPRKANTVWADSIPQGSTEWLTTPTGQTCEARRLGLEGIVEAGILGDADTLTGIIDKKHIQRVRQPGKQMVESVDVSTLVKDPDALKRVVRLVDEATPHIVVNPVVNLHFTIKSDGTTLMIPENERDPSAVYTDQIGFEDKMFLFNWAVGGSKDVTRFLDETGTSVAGVANGSGVSRPAKRTTRNRK